MAKDLHSSSMELQYEIYEKGNLESRHQHVRSLYVSYSTLFLYSRKYLGNMTAKTCGFGLMMKLIYSASWGQIFC